MNSAFRAVENRIDRGATKTRRQAESAALVHKADSTVRAYLGGLNDSAQSEACRTLIIRACEAYVGLVGHEEACGTLGYVAGLYGGPIAGPRVTARRMAEAIFNPANDGEGA
jgi:hypothetical protein